MKVMMFNIVRFACLLFVAGCGRGVKQTNASNLPSGDPVTLSLEIDGKTYSPSKGFMVSQFPNDHSLVASVDTNVLAEFAAGFIDGMQIIPNGDYIAIGVSTNFGVPGAIRLMADYRLDGEKGQFEVLSTKKFKYSKFSYNGFSPDAPGGNVRLEFDGEATGETAQAIKLRLEYAGPLRASGKSFVGK